MKPGQWERRIQRANELISAYPFAAEGLRFYARLASLQQGLYSEILRAFNGSPKISAERPLREEFDSHLLLSKLSAFLWAVASAAPVPLAEGAVTLAQAGGVNQQQVLEEFWRRDGGFGVDPGDSEDAAQGLLAPAATERLLAWIFLQPYAECLAARRELMSLDGTPSSCPVCGGQPIVGVLRPEGDGAKKSLICMLCAHEWNFRRIFCPACGEEREPQMGFYAAPELAHVRVDVCDTCQTYMKTVDLTKSGLAVPIVDELAAIPLDLWAREHGYSKLQMNLLGT